METKQTALQWLIETINERGGFIFTSHYEELFNQAKKMEKKQIKDAYKDCNDLIHIYGLDLEQYYNETYGN
jgi:hypothetical protein